MKMVREPSGACEKILAIRDSIIGKHTPENAIEYSKKYAALIEKRTNFGQQIPMKDLFIDLSVDAEKAEKILPKLKNRLENIEKVTEQKKAYQDEIVNLRNISRQSDEVKELKEALARLKELENNK